MFLFIIQPPVYDAPVCAVPALIKHPAIMCVELFVGHLCTWSPVLHPESFAGPSPLTPLFLLCWDSISSFFSVFWGVSFVNIFDFKSLQLCSHLEDMWEKSVLANNSYIWRCPDLDNVSWSIIPSCRQRSSFSMHTSFIDTSAQFSLTGQHMWQCDGLWGCCPTDWLMYEPAWHDHKDTQAQIRQRSLC